MSTRDLLFRLAAQKATYAWLCEEEHKEFATLAYLVAVTKDRKGLSRMLQATRRELYARGLEG